ncbi:DoxX family membrane protein [Corynebacterium sp. CCM 9185]|uniref:DoxX family membrane protein n=1 Tax=Corynebacterium marambiense TaxID=2765364 RepID=A0ABS0VU02_9CORY|nr:DoxX family protein [Corynebacterium marambiense]MBI9000247.1 DoxX family membrane protein [Corynebacterium marambiense]MCK7663601.1 DoxX family membrane protein [Corynebacterium marambiense]MCX7541965.1 DoxX family membrane protein [Corynebacterium marambiense]
MSDNNDPRPDRAVPEDFDDNDIPTYAPLVDADRTPVAETSRDSVYDRAGRAAPQSVGAGTEESATAVFPVAGQAPEQRSMQPEQRYADSDFATDQPTTTMPAMTGAVAPVQQVPPQSIPVDSGYPEEPVEEDTSEAKRGTMDFGLFLIRLFFGAALILHSVSVLFRLGNGGGISGLEEQFSGYELAGVLAIAVPGVELAAGILLVLGLLTPLAAALATVSTAFLALHQINISGTPVNPVQWGDGVRFALLMTVVAVGLQLTGPGRISLDFSRSWARRPLWSSIVFALIGIGCAIGLWWLVTGGAYPFTN